MTARLYLDPAEVALAAGASIELPGAAAHHALRVLRLRDGEALTLFDGTGGEWRATIAVAGRRGASVEMTNRRLSQSTLRAPAWWSAARRVVPLRVSCWHASGPKLPPMP